MLALIQGSARRVDPRVPAHPDDCARRECSGGWPSVNDWIEYESRLNDVLPRYDDPVICTYDANLLSGTIAVDILRTHPRRDHWRLAARKPALRAPGRAAARGRRAERSAAHAVPGMTREAAVKPDGDEAKRLEGCINDMISVLALPAIWTRPRALSRREHAARGAARHAPSDFAYARLRVAPAARPSRSSAQAPRPGWDARPAEVGAALARVSAGGASAALRVPPIRSMSDTIMPLGIGSDAGVLVAGSRRGDFPTKTETLLMRVAANQAGIGLREVQLLGEYRRERTRVEGERQALASLVEHSTDFIGMAAPDGQVPSSTLPVERCRARGRRRRGPPGFSTTSPRRSGTASRHTSHCARRAVEGQTRFRHFRTGAAIPMLQNIFVIKEPRTDRLPPWGRSAATSPSVAQRRELRDSERRFRLLAEAILHQVEQPARRLADYCNRRWIDYTGLTPKTSGETGGRRTFTPTTCSSSKRGRRPAPTAVRTNITLARSRWPVSSLLSRASPSGMRRVTSFSGSAPIRISKSASGPKKPCATHRPISRTPAADHRESWPPWPTS